VQAYGPGFDPSWRPPRLHVDQYLTDSDVAWLNRQMWLSGLLGPSVYANALPQPPPPPSGRRSPDTSWITLTRRRR
jgi:hypothetical protein